VKEEKHSRDERAPRGGIEGRVKNSDASENPNFSFLCDPTGQRVSEEWHDLLDPNVVMSQQAENLLTFRDSVPM
jgi:hypothetical protein